VADLIENTFPCNFAW